MDVPGKKGKLFGVKKSQCKTGKTIDTVVSFSCDLMKYRTAMGLITKKSSVAYGLVIAPENLKEGMPYKRRKFKASKADKIYQSFLN